MRGGTIIKFIISSDEPGITQFLFLKSKEIRWERERESEGEKGKERERERKR